MSLVSAEVTKEGEEGGQERGNGRDSGTNFAESPYLGLSVVVDGRLTSVNEAPDLEFAERTNFSCFVAFVYG